MSLKLRFFGPTPDGRGSEWGTPTLTHGAFIGVQVTRHAWTRVQPGVDTSVVRYFVIVCRKRNQRLIGICIRG